MTRRPRAPYLLVLPSFVYLLVAFAYPMIQGFGLALTKEGGGFTLDTIRAMRSDINFGSAFRTTMLLIIVLLPLQFVVAMAMALVVNSKIRGQGLLLYIYAVPLVLSEVAAGVIWYGILTQNGYLNSFLEQIGVLDEPTVFLDGSNKTSLLVCVVLAEIWRATSIMFVTLVSGLQSLPHEYHEACEVFGAGPVKRLVRITLPLLKPTIQVALIIRVVLAVQAFALVSILGGSGIQTLATEAFGQATIYDNKRLAAGYAGLILIVALGFVGAILLVFRVRSEDRS
jgi:multiple sugar transport system permease protein